MAERLPDAVHGCLIGAAIGDALGAPVENWHHAEIRATHGKVDRFLPAPHRADRPGAGTPGYVTDDTAVRHCLCLAIVRRGGRITPDDYARAWLDALSPRRVFATERIVLEKLRIGMNPWSTGDGQPLANAATMSIAPAGLINAGDPRQAYQDAYTLARMHQRGFECEAAATIAAGVARAVVPGATVDAVLEAMREHGSAEARKLMAIAAELADDVDEFVERFYATMLDRSFPVRVGETFDKDNPASPTSRELLPAVTGLLALCGGHHERCVVEAASLGRDADSIATVIGALAGALTGASGIRADWIEVSETVNADLFDEVEGLGFAAMAERLVAALAAERDAARERAASLDAWLRPRGPS